MPPFAFFDELLGGVTLKQTLGIAGSVGGLAGTAGYWLGSRWQRDANRNLRHQVDALKARVAGLDDDILRVRADRDALTKAVADEKARVGRRDATIGDLKKKLVPFFHAYQKIKPEHDRVAAELTEARALLAKLMAETGDAGEQIRILGEKLEERKQDLARTERRVRQALALDGRLWAAKALQGVPKFRPLADRRRAIVSVLNLKGGVGKTTITAHLGFAFARRGYRVLLIDLDLQGSLTGLLLPADKFNALATDGLLVQDFLRAAATNHHVKLDPYIHPVHSEPGSGGSVSIVGASDHLAYAELSLTLGWLLRTGDKDVRFLIRRALHRAGQDVPYDLVLLDCPPLVNISCVNALAASDRVLIPVTPGRRAAERVPVLLKRFLRDEKFTKHVNHTGVLGVVANRTYGAQLTAGERADWDRMGQDCLDVSGESVKRFDTVIATQVRELRDAETQLSAPPADSKLGQAFAALAGELEQELPSECRRRPNAVPQPV
ncbi:MAG: AAA family ATPase [Fimbriiglobus sp.]